MPVNTHKKLKKNPLDAQKDYIACVLLNQSVMLDFLKQNPLLYKAFDKAFQTLIEAIRDIGKTDKQCLTRRTHIQWCESSKMGKQKVIAEEMVYNGCHMRLGKAEEAPQLLRDIKKSWVFVF